MSGNKAPEAHLLTGSILTNVHRWSVKFIRFVTFSLFVPHRYRTLFKPQYKVGYKTITELEWRCCPGFSGESCGDGPTSESDVMMPPFRGSFPRPGVKGYPRGHPNIPFPFPGGHPDNKPIPSGYLPPETPKTSFGKCKLHSSHNSSVPPLATWLWTLPLILTVGESIVVKNRLWESNDVYFVYYYYY